MRLCVCISFQYLLKKKSHFQCYDTFKRSTRRHLVDSINLENQAIYIVKIGSLGFRPFCHSVIINPLICGNILHENQSFRRHVKEITTTPFDDIVSCAFFLSKLIAKPF